MRYILEAHILEDVNKCVLALEEGDAETLGRTSDAISGRSARVCSVVTAEMDNYDPCVYTQQVLKAVGALKDQGIFAMYFNCCCVLNFDWESICGAEERKSTLKKYAARK